MAFFLLYPSQPPVQKKGSDMPPIAQIPAAGTDLRHIAVQLVICDEFGQPRKKRVWGLLRLLRSVTA